MVLTTEMVKNLVGDLMRGKPLSPEERVKFLPTYDQTKILITFLRASKACEGVKSTEKVDMIIPKRAVCIGEKFKEFYPETEEWVKSHPNEFDKIYRSIVWGW